MVASVADSALNFIAVPLAAETVPARTVVIELRA